MIYLNLIMIAIGFTTTCVAYGYGAGLFGGIYVGMVAGFFIPLIVLAILEPWIGPFNCEECNDDLS